MRQNPFRFSHFDCRFYAAGQRIHRILNTDILNKEFGIVSILIPTVNSDLFFQQPVSVSTYIDNIRAGAVCSEFDERRVVCAFDELFLGAILSPH